jgi:hypothetical protein
LGLFAFSAAIHTTLARIWPLADLGWRRNCHALDLLPEMVARYVEPFTGAAMASDGAELTR